MEAIMDKRHPALMLAVLAVLFACAATACAQEQPAPDLAADSGAESEIDTRAEAKLAAVVPAVNFQAAKLQDVIEFLAKTTGVNFYANWSALKGAGVDMDRPITVKLTNVPADKVLRLVPQQATADETNPVESNLDDGVVIISTRSDLNKTRETRVYDIHALLVNGPELPSPWVPEIIDTFPSTKGGPSPNAQAGTGLLNDANGLST
jgi:hypothetical protein